MADVILVPLAGDDREQFILDNKEAFNYGALEEFGRRDDHFEEDDQIISRETIENSIDSGEAYRIMLDDEPVGGVIIKTDGNHGELEILFVSPNVHSKGIGYSAWCAVEKLHPEVTVWETINLTGGYHEAGCGCHRQCGQFSDARMLCADAHLHR